MTYEASPCTVQSGVHLPSTRGTFVYSTLYSTQVWSASEVLPSVIDVSYTIHESRALVEALPSIRSVPYIIHIPEASGNGNK